MDQKKELQLKAIMAAISESKAHGELATMRAITPPQRACCRARIAPTVTLKADPLPAFSRNPPPAIKGFATKVLSLSQVEGLIEHRFFNEAVSRYRGQWSRTRGMPR